MISFPQIDSASHAGSVNFIHLQPVWKVVLGGTTQREFEKLPKKKTGEFSEVASNGYSVGKTDDGPWAPWCPLREWVKCG